MKKNYSHYFFYFLLINWISAIFALNVQSSECDTEIDLYKSSSLLKMPVVDQDGSGTCYGFVAAQLIEFENHLRNFTVHPSGIDLAVKNGEGWFFNNSTIEGGLVADLIESVNNRGLSSRTCVESKIKDFTSGTGLTTAQFANLLEILRRANSNADTPEEYLAFFPTATKDIQDSLAQIENCNYPLMIERLDEVGMLGGNVISILSHYVSDCKTHLLPYKLNFSLKETPEETAEREIDSFLANNKPAYIGFCAETFDQKSAVDLRPYSGRSQCGNHATLVVGKRKNKAGVCEYLIRNSWGGDWSPPGIDCAFKDSTGKYYQDDDEANKELRLVNSGYSQSFDDVQEYVGCWISADKIINNTYRVGGMK